ncbi:MAG TPA: site-specific integrase [Steroidobacteraceae bacterium]|nr:site-specific integrase [Steroidobacteraceae bacterium]
MATQNLTSTAIERLRYDPHGPSRQVLWDKRVPGLGVRIMPSSKCVFILLYRTLGRARRSRLMHLGRVADFRNVTEAREVASEHLRKLRRDKIDPLTERRRDQSAGTIAEMLGLWLAEVSKECAARTVADYSGYVTTYLNPAIGKYRPEELTRAEARRLHAKLTAERGAVTANRVMQALRAAYSWALKQDSDTLPPGFGNPMTAVKWNAEAARSEFIQPAELPKLTSAIQTETDPWARAYLWLLLLTGARGGELLKLRWSDVSLEAGEMVLRETKNKTDFKLKLPGAAVDLLRKIPRVAGNDHVFPPQRGEGDHMGKPRAAWARVLKRAGISRNVTFHDLRRSAGVLLSARGFTAEQIARQLNHKSNVTAKVYVRIADNIQQRMADVLGSAVTGVEDSATKATELPPPHQRVKRRSTNQARA